MLLKIVYVLTCRILGLVVILFRSDRAIAAGTPYDVITVHERGRIKTWSCWITDAGGISFPRLPMS